MSVMAQLRADEAIFPESTIGSEQASPRESANVVEQASVSEGATRNEPASLEGAIDPERGMITESTTAKEHNGYVKRSEEHTSELQSLAYLVCRLLLEKKKSTQEVSIDRTSD